MKNQRLLIGLIFCFSVSFLSHPAEVPAQADPFIREKQFASSSAQRRADFMTDGRGFLPDTWQSIFPGSLRSLPRTCPAPAPL